MKNCQFLILLFWTIHTLAFCFQNNYFPVFEYDLFARTENFSYVSEKIFAKTESNNFYDLDISNEIAFGPYWKFIVTIRRIIRENPSQLENIIRKRIIEINTNRQDPVKSVQFVEYDKNLVKKIVFEISL